ncbi:hypothetical protein FRC10_004788 [Ceratobasidium sp. 414]|nr:hypothetical protein FRC10_004788 [Ceratobasidium sp. 414]
MLLMMLYVYKKQACLLLLLITQAYSYWFLLTAMDLAYAYTSFASDAALAAVEAPSAPVDKDQSSKGQFYCVVA